MSAKCLGIACALCASMSGTVVESRVVDHTSVMSWPAMSQAAIDGAKNQSVYFAHASIGGNMVYGLSDLHGIDPVRYPFEVQTVDGTVPAGGVTDGKIYEFYRGNIGWEQKVDAFAAELAGGWGNAADIVINKLCYLDASSLFLPLLPDNAWSEYAVSNSRGTALAQLELLYPSTQFVYVTMPVIAATAPVGYVDEFNRQEALARVANFNTQLRLWTQANNKLLLDLADIESHDPSGNAVTTLIDGQMLPTLHIPYAHPDDYLHLNYDGYLQAATGVYATIVVPEPTVLGLVLPLTVLLARRERRLGATA